MKERKVGEKVYILSNEKIITGEFVSSSPNWSYFKLEDGTVAGFGDRIIFDGPEEALEALVEIYEKKLIKVQGLKIDEFEKVVLKALEKKSKLTTK